MCDIAERKPLAVEIHDRVDGGDSEAVLSRLYQGVLGKPVGVVVDLLYRADDDTLREQEFSITPVALVRIVYTPTFTCGESIVDTFA